MAVVTRKVTICKCNKCSHEWEGRGDVIIEPPKMCPKCKTLKWDDRKLLTKLKRK